MRRTQRLLSFVWRAATLLFDALVFVWSLLLGALGVLRAWRHFATDVIRARWLLRGGALHCPNGHVLETEGATYTCLGCGWTYTNGSIWLCPNVECKAPVNPFINCDECGCSVRNPYRWGRP